MRKLGDLGASWSLVLDSKKNFFESIVFQIDSKNFILIYSFPKYGFSIKKWFSKYMVFQNMVFQKNFFESIVFQIDSKNFILIYSFPKYGFPKKISLNL